MPNKILSYVMSNDLGNSSRARRNAGGKQRRNASIWQNTHRNLQ
jgi:hypothetical protein